MLNNACKRSLNRRRTRKLRSHERIRITHANERKKKKDTRTVVYILHVHRTQRNARVLAINLEQCKHDRGINHHTASAVAYICWLWIPRVRYRVRLQRSVVVVVVVSDGFLLFASDVPAHTHTHPSQNNKKYDLTHFARALAPCSVHVWRIRLGARSKLMSRRQRCVGHNFRLCGRSANHRCPRHVHRAVFPRARAIHFASAACSSGREEGAKGRQSLQNDFPIKHI